MKLVSTLGMKIARANFGAAIISPGDLNLDGYNGMVFVNFVQIERDFTIFKV